MADELPHLVVAKNGQRDIHSSSPYFYKFSDEHTPGHVDCPGCERSRIGIMRKDPKELSRMAFQDAAPLWLTPRKDKLKPRTYAMYEHYVGRLKTFFKDVELERIDGGMIHAYQEFRKAKAGASAINHEIECVLGPVLQKAGLWDAVKIHYERIPAPSWQPPKVMTEEQEEHLFKVAARNPDWQVAYWVCSITNNTSASGQELRKLRLQDVDLKEKVMRVPAHAAKNSYRDRVIPLNEIALKQFTRVIERAKGLGANRPEHFIFPKRISPNHFDVTLCGPPSFIRVSFDNLKDAAELSWITPHCFRHQIITKMLENGAPEETVRAIAGHVSGHMMRHYSHTRIQAKAAVLDGLNRKKA